MGTGEIGKVQRESVQSFQGYDRTYKGFLEKPQNAYGANITKHKFGSTISGFNKEDMSRNDNELANEMRKTQGAGGKGFGNTLDQDAQRRVKMAKSALRSGQVALHGDLLKQSRDELIKTSWQQRRGSHMNSGSQKKNFFERRN